MEFTVSPRWKWSRISDASDLVVVYLGVGQNFILRPRIDLRLSGGVFMVVRLWNATLKVRQK